MTKAKAKYSMIKKSFPYITILLSLILALAYLHDFSSTRVLLTEDSNDYLAYSNAIRSNTFVAATDRAVVRTAFYPFLLSLVLQNEPSNFDEVKKLHIIFSLLCLALVVCLIPPTISRSQALLVSVFVLGLCRVFAYSVLTEWVSINLFILLFALLYRQLMHSSTVNIASIGLLASLLALTRPVFIFLVFLPLIICFISSTTKSAYGYAIASLLPILFFIAINYQRYGEMTLSPFLGPSIFGVASILETGAAPVLNNSDSRKFFDVIKDDIKIENNSRINNYGLEKLYNKNVWLSANSIRQQFGWTYMYWNKVLISTGFAIIAASPSVYLSYVSRQFFEQFYLIDFWFLVLVAAAVITAVCNKNKSISSKVFFIALGIHFLHTLICSATNVIFYRLFAVTFYPLLWCAIVQIIVFVISEWQKRYLSKA